MTTVQVFLLGSEADALQRPEVRGPQPKVPNIVVVTTVSVAKIIASDNNSSDHDNGYDSSKYYRRLGIVNECCGLVVPVLSVLPYLVADTKVLFLQGRSIEALPF